MFAKFKFTKFVAALLFIISPYFLKGQCAPEISVIFQKLSLDYFEPEDTPTNLASIDVDLGDDSMNGEYNVTNANTSWQTTGTYDFTGLLLTGSITIHYTDLSTEVCAYNGGIYFNPLPVELSVFNGHLMGNDVFLTWSTESESNNAGFEIERSYDGDNFERIASKSGAGNSEEKLWYSFEDFDVKNAALGNAVYYRIKQINYDQTYSYSWVVAVDLKIKIDGFEITKILGWNSPDRIIQVYYHNPTEIRKINISVATINGQIIERKSLYPQTGFNFFEVDFSNQKENMFFISLNNGKQTTVKKIILQSID